MRLLMDAAQITADREKWLTTRLDGIGASEIGVIMRLPAAGGIPHGSPYALWREKTGRATAGLPPSRKMEFGLYTENFAAWVFEEDHPELHVTPGGLYAHDTRPWHIATFDRLAHEPTGTCLCRDSELRGSPDLAALATRTIQIKMAAWRDFGKIGIPPAYRAQVIWEMAIKDAEEGILAVLDPAQAEVQSYLIRRDARWDRDLEVMLDAAGKFRDLVTRDVPPKVDGLPATTLALSEDNPEVVKDKTFVVPAWLALRWKRAKIRADAYALLAKRWENEMRSRAGDAGRWVIEDPAQPGGVQRIADRRISSREAHEVKASPRIDGVYPYQGWQLDKPVRL